MEAFLTDFQGNSVALPVILEWDFSYGTRLPCDCFEIGFIYDRTMLGILESAVEFRAVHMGETVFVGVVDDFEVSIGERGSLATIRGRGLAARLLDNEAEAAQFFSAGLDLILEKYVFPFRISALRRNASCPNQALVVDSGVSCYKVLSDFLWFGAKARPRFSRDGVLILGQEAGKHFEIDGSTAVLTQSLKGKRYGVISEALVKNKAAGASSLVLNQKFLNVGGFCRRVVNVPRRTSYNAMRANGEYQIEQSEKEQMLISLKLPTAFQIFAGDLVTLKDSPLGSAGEFAVRRSRCFADGDSCGTEIILARGD